MKITRTTLALVLALSFVVNLQQWLASLQADAEREAHREYLKHFPYERAQLLKDKKTGDVYVKLLTPSGRRILHYAGVCPAGLPL